MVLIAVLLLQRMIPKVELLEVFCVTPQAISRFLIMLLVAPAPAPVLVSQIAAVADAVLVFETVIFLPTPPILPSIVTLSAPVNFIIAPVIFPETVTGTVAVTDTLAYEAEPDPLAFNAAVAVSVVLPDSELVITPW